MNNFIRTAKLAASRAGKILRDGFRKHHRLTYKLPHHQAIVTEVDRAAERSVIATIHAAHPDHAILGEEYGLVGPSDARYRWIVDPLDGTSNYVHGIPLFNVALALQDRGATVLGCVRAPMTDEWFLALRGKGAWRNDVRARVSPQRDLAQSYGFIEWTNEDASENDQGMRIVDAIRSRHIRIRNIASGVLVLSWVGAGCGDYAVSIGSKLWDVAAAILFIEEAGGRVTDFSGKTTAAAWQGDPFAHCPLIATNAHMHAQLLRIVRAAVRRKGRKTL